LREPPRARSLVSNFYEELMKTLRTGFASLALLTAAGMIAPSYAGFFIPKGTTMAMFSLTPDEQNYDLAYGFHRRLSGSVGLTRVREDAFAPTGAGEAKAPWRNVFTTHAAYLINRTSTTDGIFNAYVFGGPIVEKLQGDGESAKLGVQSAIWLDYETRRIYTRAKFHAFKSERWRRNEVIAQAMIAPYEADYEDIASWGGVQVKRVSGDRTEITPFVRFFQRNWWIDAGISVDRKHRNDFFVNFMYTF
jgi:hypothetical protein